MKTTSKHSKFQTSNYFMNFIHDKPNEELMKQNEEKYSTLNKLSVETDNIKKLILKNAKQSNASNILSPKKKENQKINGASNSKMKISYLKHFNNNSIYFSSNKKNNAHSAYKKKCINKEIKSKNANEKQDFNNEKKKTNIKKLIYMKNPTRYSLSNKRYHLDEESKINSNIDEIQKINFFFDMKDGAKKELYNAKEQNNNYNETEKQFKPKKKLLNVISSETIFDVENNDKINILNVSTPNKINNNLTEINIFPEKINLKEYEILNIIGKGSFGQIYKVKWNKNNNIYALKEMHFQNKDKILNQKERVKIIKDFQKNVNNNGLIKIYGDFQCKKGDIYYYYKIMEYADRDWEQEINIRNNNLNYYSENEIIDIMRQLIKTLSLLQKNHITHRDIKLQNILLINNKYKICDFGESRKLNQKGNIIQPVRGSELYMSPILFDGLNQKLSQVTHNTYKSDVFSLGMCILYASTLNMISLYEIREMTDMNDIKKIIEKHLDKRYSKSLIELILCMLNVDERKRPDFIQLEKMISQFEIKT